MHERTRGAPRGPYGEAPDESPAAVCPGRYDGDVTDGDGRTACRAWPTSTAGRRPRAECEPTREATRYLPGSEHGFGTVGGGNDPATVPA